MLSVLSKLPRLLSSLSRGGNSLVLSRALCVLSSNRCPKLVKLQHNRLLRHERSYATVTEGNEAKEQIDAEEEMKDKEKERIRLKMERNMKLTGYVMAAFGVVGGVVWIGIKGSPLKDGLGNPIQDEFSNETILPLQYVKRATKEFSQAVQDWREPVRVRLLPDPLPEPYIQPKYTLVVELTGILVHPEWTYGTGWRFKKRAAVDYFLRQVGYPNFEVVIYTAEGGFTAHPIVDSLDPDQRIMFRLYRDSTKYVRDTQSSRFNPIGHHVKDLDKLNRPLSKVIVLDWDPNSFQNHPENALRVPKWQGDMDDTGLVDIAELLKTILTSGADDVRPILEHYSQSDDPAKEFRERSMAFQISQGGEPGDETQASKLAKGYSGKLFGFRRHS